MKIEELKNIEGLEGDQVVKIWKMNYGFRSDLQGEISTVSLGITGKKEVNIDIRKMRLYYLVFGIYEAESLGIPKPADIDLGLSSAELNNRIKAVRKLDGDVAVKIFEEVQKINNLASESEEDTIKKELPVQ